MRPHALDGSDLIRRADAVMREYAMLAPGETVLVGLSGGPDSVCLLRVLCSLRGQKEFSLRAIYVNHNLRPDEIPAEIEFCSSLCAELGVPFQACSVDVAGRAKERRMNRQDAARELRYQALETEAVRAGAARIALAHTLDDQAETLIMRLVRGSGLSGLAGIPPKRGKIIRPLIETSRDEVEAFLREGGYRSMLDSSNLSSDYLRNHVRLSLVPALKKLNPRLLQAAARTARICRDEDQYLELIVTKTLMKLISRKTAVRLELFLAPLETLDTVILRRLLRRAVDAAEGLRGVGFDQIEEISGLIRTGSSGDRLMLPKGVRVVRDYSLLVITSELPGEIACAELNPPGEVGIPGSGLAIRASFVEAGAEAGAGKNETVLDADLLRFPLLIRAREKGDFFYPLGFGGRKKLQDFFVDEKVPRDERDAVPIVVSGDDIVWVAGFRADERFRVTAETKKFLRLGIVKGKK